MRDIYPRPEEEATPDRPPLPKMQRQRLTNTKRKFMAFALAVLLGVAMIAAAAGTIMAQVGSINGSFFPSGPLGAISNSISDLYKRITGFAGSSVQVLALGRDFVSLLPDLMQGKRGDELLAFLARADQQLSSLGSDSLVPVLGARASDLGHAAGIVRTWLVAQPERHIAVVFANSAEMRAGGGFIGSYAEVTLKGGAITNVTVRDITEADRASSDRTIPPVQLEPIADRWRAADANWFLAGPDSGAAFLDLLNRSPLYATNKVDAVVFVAPRVVSDLLAVTGPISAGDVQVDKDNFLRVIQEEVQQGQAAGDATPKAVLTQLVPKFTSQVMSSIAGSPLALLDAIRGGVARRDIVVYASDADVERAIGTFDLGGTLYPTDDKFIGGYVAVAPSTIGGDKTDAVTSQEIHVREQLLPSGLVETYVAVERVHQGKESDPWWYKEEHRSYVKVYAPQGSIPTAASGQWIRERNLAHYSSEYTKYEPLKNAESTLRSYDGVKGVEVFEESGKEVLGFWQRTPRGSGTVASVTYARQLPRTPQAGSTYTFVLERQPASTSKYDIQLFAPPGLVWKDTGTSQYTFTSDDPDGRTVKALELTSAN